MTIHQNPRDKQPPHTGKVENDTNKLGEQDPTQINQGKRTPKAAVTASRMWAAATSRNRGEGQRGATTDRGGYLGWEPVCADHAVVVRSPFRCRIPCSGGAQ